MKITNTKQKQCMPHMHVCLSPCSGHRCVPSHSLCRYTGLLWHYIDWKGPRWHHSHILKESPTCCQKLRETSYPLTAQVKWHHLYNSFCLLTNSTASKSFCAFDSFLLSVLSLPSSFPSLSTICSSPVYGSPYRGVLPLYHKGNGAAIPWEMLIK